jgi:hypothetical protein
VDKFPLKEKGRVTLLPKYEVDIEVKRRTPKAVSALSFERKGVSG